MVVREFSIVIMIALLAVAAIGVGTKYITKKDDSPIEELAEEIIEDQTGLNIDLTPDSKEEDKK